MGNEAILKNILTFYRHKNLDPLRTTLKSSGTTQYLKKLQVWKTNRGNNGRKQGIGVLEILLIFSMGKYWKSTKKGFFGPQIPKFWSRAKKSHIGWWEPTLYFIFFFDFSGNGRNQSQGSHFWPFLTKFYPNINEFTYKWWVTPISQHFNDFLPETFFIKTKCSQVITQSVKFRISLALLTKNGCQEILMLAL